jgi:hypothetical protein
VIFRHHCIHHLWKSSFFAQKTPSLMQDRRSYARNAPYSITFSTPQCLLLLGFPFKFSRNRALPHILSPFAPYPITYQVVGVGIWHTYQMVRGFSVMPHILSPFAPYLITFRPISYHLKYKIAPYPITFRPISYHLTPRIFLFLSHFSGPKPFKRCSFKHLKQQQGASRPPADWLLIF